MKECIYCQDELKSISRDLPNYYFCSNCFQNKLVAVLYSYDSWGDRYTSIYLDFWYNNSHIRVGIQPYLNKTHVVSYGIPRDKSDELIIHLEGFALHFMLHPHAAMNKDNLELVLPLNTLLTPDNVKDKISLYLLLS